MYVKNKCQIGELLYSIPSKENTKILDKTDST